MRQTHFTRLRGSLTLLTAALISLPNATSAEWIATNPGGGGALNSPVITHEGYWAVGSDLGGVYWSDTKGAAWEVVGADRGLTATHVASLASHPAGTLLIGTDDGLFLGRSDGHSVSHVYPGGYIPAIAVSADPLVVYAARHETYDGAAPQLLGSTDAGRTWSKIDHNLPRAFRVLALRAHPTSPHTLWALSGEGRFATTPAQAWRSDDGGKTWQRRDPGEGEVVDLAYSAQENGTTRVILTTEHQGRGAVWTSDDAGSNWRALSDNTKALDASGVILPDARDPNRLRLIDFNYRSHTTTSFLWSSEDAGATWVRRENTASGGWSRADEDWGMGSSYQGLTQTIGYRADNPNTLLWSNNQFLFHSTDGGRSWHDSVSHAQGAERWSSRGLDNVVPLVVEVSDADPNVVYAGYMDLGLWGSRNGGRSWRNLNDTRWSHNWGGKGGNTFTVLADPDEASVVWAQVAGDRPDPWHLLHSTDHGRSWTALTGGLPARISQLDSLVLDPYSPPGERTLFATVDGDIYKGVNNGSSWTKVLACGDCHGLQISDAVLFAFGPSGVWRSVSDHGALQWQPMALPVELTDGWTPGQHWLNNAYTYSGPIELATRGVTEMWLAIKGQDKGFYYSDTAGKTWQRVHRSQHARSVAVDPKTGEVLIGTSSALHAGGYAPDSEGILVHPHGRSATAWQPLNHGLAYPFATRVKVEPDGQRWSISPGQGVMVWR